MNTLKIGQHCPVHKGIYAGIVRSFSSEPDNHIWLLDAKSPNELMNWTDAMEWAESLGEAIDLPTRYEAALLGCNLAEELGDYGYVWTSTSEGVRIAWLQLWYSSRPNSQGTAGKTNTIHVRAVKRLPVTYEMKGHPLATPAQAAALVTPSDDGFMAAVNEMDGLYAAPAQAVPASVIMASVMRDDGGEHPAFCLMVAYRAEKDAKAALAMLTDEPAQQAAPAPASHPVAAPTQAGEYPAGTGNPEADRIIGRLASSDPDFDDCADAVALIHKLVAEIKGPDGFATWKDAAVAERVRHVEATRIQAATEHPPLPRHDWCLNCSPVMPGYTADQMHAYADATCAAREATQASPVDANVQQDAERWQFFADYMVSTRTDLDDEIVGCDSVQKMARVLDAARATQKGSQ